MRAGTGRPTYKYNFIFIKSQKTYGSGGGTEDWNSEDCCVLGKAGDRASF